MIFQQLWMQVHRQVFYKKQEHHFIENVFELEERTVPSSMTTRENVVYFTLKENENSIRQKLAEYPYSKFLCL